jgi:hypothetical protein
MRLKHADLGRGKTTRNAINSIAYVEVKSYVRIKVHTLRYRPAEHFACPLPA